MASCGTDGTDIIFTGDTDDVIFARGGNDFVYSGGGNDTIFGGDGIDWLFGGDGDDFIDGGPGVDLMAGGAGNDTYVVDNPWDIVMELPNQGTDMILSFITLALPMNVENLTLEGTSAINGTGNWLNNVLTGNSADNVLDGGWGADTLFGGKGNDTYIVDNPGDVVVENPNEGIDTVQSSVSYTLSANVENLTLTGRAANGTGNELNNVIMGNGADNMLDGGAGADTMIGGAGNDTYVVDNAGDVVTENPNQGTDTVLSSISYTLPGNVENLTLTGSAAINGTGNELNNVLIGNSADNILDGGTGADTMLGGQGNDTYVVDNPRDVVIENPNEGIDTVQSSISYTLSNNVENLTLTGTAAINGTGNSLDNVLMGNSGSNILNGGDGNDTLVGGGGNDTLNGGKGNDTYIFAPGDGNDTIVDRDRTPGNTDTIQMGYDPLDLIFSRSGNNLNVAPNTTTDQVTVQNWYKGADNQTEVFKAADGSQLLNTQVDQLIQSMASFCSDHGGISWGQAAQQDPTQVQQVIAQFWQPHH